MSKGSEALQALLDDATRRQDAIAQSVVAAERTLVKRRAKLAEAQAEVRSLNADLAAISGRSHLSIAK